MAVGFKYPLTVKYWQKPPMGNRHHVAKRSKKEYRTKAVSGAYLSGLEVLRVLGVQLN
jgi:hypothetical protein